ncbi:MAG: hypothetical protein ABJ024_11985, partial [Lentilitoribacter sp.]
PFINHNYGLVSWIFVLLGFAPNFKRNFSTQEAEVERLLITLDPFLDWKTECQSSQLDCFKGT